MSNKILKAVTDGGLKIYDVDSVTVGSRIDGANVPEGILYFYTGIDDNGVFVKTQSISINADSISLDRVESSTYDDVQDWFNTTQASGKISGGAITNNENGTISVAAGAGIIKSSNEDISSTKFFDWAQNTSVSLSNNNINYIYVDYNSGNPLISATITKADIDGRTKIMLGKVYKNGNGLHIVSAGMILTEHTKRILEYITIKNGDVSYGSGMVVAKQALSLSFSVSSGILLAGLTKISVPSFNSIADSFSYWYKEEGEWHLYSTDHIDNTSFNDDDGLTALSNNYYGCHFVFVDDDGTIHVVFGDDEYKTLAMAEDSSVRNDIPPSLNGFSVLLAKIIVKEGNSSIQEVCNVGYANFQRNIAYDFASPPAIGNITPNEGYFTTINSTNHADFLDVDTLQIKIDGSILCDSQKNITGTTIKATGTHWIYFAAVTGIPSLPFGWAQQVSGCWVQNAQSPTCLISYDNNECVYFPLSFVSGTVLSKLRVKFQGGTPDDGVSIRLLKRQENSTTTAWTVIGSQQTYKDDSILVMSYTLPSTTVMEGYSYTIEVKSNVATSESVILYSVGIETSNRNL